MVILIPLAFGLARKTKKSTLYYVIPLLAGLATGFAFIPPSAGSVLVANMLGVDLGVMIAVGVPVGILITDFCRNPLGKIYRKENLYRNFPPTMSGGKRQQKEGKIPSFWNCSLQLSWYLLC